jgi:5-formyltetrahydrofolate cyclo-ligase
MTKAEVRKAMIARRLTLAPAEREQLARAAQDALIGSEPFRRARLILLYEAFRGEAATDRIAAAAVAAGKRLALPRVSVNPRRLWLHAYSGDPATLSAGAYGIREPDPAWPLVALADVDLVVVPGVAFDRQGNRLGYGGGYYDRTLPEVRAANPAAALIGLAFSFQIVPSLPADPHDMAVDGVATNDGLIRY